MDNRKAALADTMTDAMTDKLKALEQRIAALEKQLAQTSTTLVTPVNIIDPQGKQVVQIDADAKTHSIKLFAADGSLAASLGSEPGGAHLSLRNAQGKVLALIDIERFGGRLQLMGEAADSGGLALFGGDADQAGGGINIFGATPQGGIELWADAEGGEISLQDAEGNTRAIDARADHATSAD